MASRFVRRVRTTSGAVAVQIITRIPGEADSIEHVGSAHTDAELAVLMALARDRVAPGQGELDLGALAAVPARMDDIADWTAAKVEAADAATGVGRPVKVAAGGRTVRTSATVLWRVLTDAYTRLGFDVVDDEAFRAMVLARLIEPTSKADTVRVLASVGAPPVALRTLFRSLQRVNERGYRDQIARACLAYSLKATGPATFVMYDVTTLHFENDDEDTLRRVGMSKEHRVDPQVQVGLLVDQAGVPLEMHLFEGNKAETTTLIPVLHAFQTRHGIDDIVVVADAGMLSAGNLNALEDAGLSFIVGSRLTKAPYDLDDHFHAHGNHFTDGQILESTRVMGSGAGARERRIVYQWSFKRNKRDDRNINLMIAKAERIAAGQMPLRKTRFLKVSGARKELDQATIDRARQLAGIKGYVTNIPPKIMPGSAIIGAYHDLWKVEQSFRMTKSDLKARPVFHHRRDAIEAHLTVVFAALAIARHLQAAGEMSIKKIITTLREVRSSTVSINGETITFEAELEEDVQALLDRLESSH
ncbi:IS1634 family transposase ISMsm6 [Demequina sediminis]|uniref:IS1634 family transposase ISMsm6 n=1 Tax=Demequina sediminis TaxID=1930058 RepID=A0ABP9WJQ4_9MICO